MTVAQVYDRMDETLGRRCLGFVCARSLMPHRLGIPGKWTPEMRCVQAQVLREVSAQERQVIDEIEALLPKSEGSDE